MRFDEVNLTNANFFIFFKFVQFVNFNQKYELTGDILKVHSLVKRLTLGNFFCIFCKYYYFALGKHWPTSGSSPNLKLT